jgi:hypothetical protein
MIWTAEQYDATNLVLKEGICPSKSGATSGDGLGNWIILDSSELRHSATQNLELNIQNVLFGAD